MPRVGVGRRASFHRKAMETLRNRGSAGAVCHWANRLSKRLICFATGDALVGFVMETEFLPRRKIAGSTEKPYVFRVLPPTIARAKYKGGECSRCAGVGSFRPPLA